MSPSAYVMIGIITGSIASVMLMAYITRQVKAKKTNKKKMRKGPSSGSPLNSFDEEKSI